MYMVSLDNYSEFAKEINNDIRICTQCGKSGSSSEFVVLNRDNTGLCRKCAYGNKADEFDNKMQNTPLSEFIEFIDQSDL